MAERSSVRRPALGGSLLTIAVMTMNVTTYAFTILAARLLGPAEFGAVGALSGVLLVLNVVALGLQTTGARRVSVSPGHRQSIEQVVLATSWRLGLALTLVCLLATPLFNRAFRLDSWLTAAVMALSLLPQTVLFGRVGVLQGERRWLSLVWVYASFGVVRLVAGGIAMAISPTALSAMIGVALGALIPMLMAGAVLRRGRTPAATDADAPAAEPTDVAPGIRELVLEVARNSHVLLAFLAVSGSDIVVARVILSDHESGLYAAGLILVKAILFLPQFVILLAFPSLSTGGARGQAVRRTALIAVFAMGMAVIAGTALFPDLALIVVGGPEYAALTDHLWLYAVLGTALSIMQLLVYDVVARQSHWVTTFIWLALVAILCSIPFVTSELGLLKWVTVVDVTCTSVLVLLTRRISERPRASSGPSRSRRPAAR